MKKIKFFAILVSAFAVTLHAENNLALPSIGDEDDVEFEVPQIQTRQEVSVQAEGTTMTIIPHVSPSPQSASWSTYRVNAMQGISSGVPTVGTGPSMFRVLGSNEVLPPGAITLTSFPYWMEMPNPTAPYENERGNRLHAGLKIVSATQFRLADVFYQMRGSDPANSLFFQGSFETNTYSGTRVGRWYGPDQIKGTADDVTRTSGSGTAPVNELEYIGIANAYSAVNLAGVQQIRDYIAQNRPFNVTFRYSVIIGTNTATAERSIPFIGALDIAFIDTVPTSSGNLGDIRLVAAGETMTNAMIEIRGNYSVSVTSDASPIQKVVGPQGSQLFMLPTLSKEVTHSFRLSADPASGTGPFVAEIRARAVGETSGQQLGSDVVQRTFNFGPSPQVRLGAVLVSPGQVWLTVSGPTGTLDIYSATRVVGPWVLVNTFAKTGEVSQLTIGTPGSAGFFRAVRR